MKNQKSKSEKYDYDVCLSFAGEDRNYVEEVADELRNRGIRVFYDRYEQVELWGKDLYTHLDDIYSNSARFCVVFSSCHYAKKLWTNHERQSAQERAFKENQEYILPVRFDDTKIPGIRETVGYLDLKHISSVELAGMIHEKIGERQGYDYFPPVPDLLYDEFEASEEDEINAIYSGANNFYSVLRRMNNEERFVVFQFFIFGCPAELPENIHINTDLLRRTTKFSIQKLKRILGNLDSIGFFVSQKESDGSCGLHGLKTQMFVLEWHDMSVSSVGNATDIADKMIRLVTEDYCEVCGLNALQNLDFSNLSSVTKVIEGH